MVAEVVHGAPYRFSAPARFSFAHGGKDRHPFPVPLRTYDESLNFLRTSLARAKVGHKDTLDRLRPPAHFSHAVENPLQPKRDFAAGFTHENQISTTLL